MTEINPEFLAAAVEMAKRISPENLIRYVYYSGKYDGLVEAFQLTAKQQARSVPGLTEYQDRRGDCYRGYDGPEE